MISMGNRYQTGNYHITIFDKYGTPQEKIKEGITSYTAGLEIGRNALAKNENYGSFTVLRVVHNSLDSTTFLFKD